MNEAKADLIDYRGTRVILINKRYSANNFDPVWGSKFACVGITVGETGDRNAPVRVAWDNHRRSIYKFTDLKAYSEEKVEDNPNLAFRRAKESKSEKVKPNKPSTWKPDDTWVQLMSDAGKAYSDETLDVVNEAVSAIHALKKANRHKCQALGKALAKPLEDKEPDYPQADLDDEDWSDDEEV